MIFPKKWALAFSALTLSVAFSTVTLSQTPDSTVPTAAPASAPPAPQQAATPAPSADGSVKVVATAAIPSGIFDATSQTIMPLDEITSAIVSLVKTRSSLGKLGVAIAILNILAIRIQ